MENNELFGEPRTQSSLKHPVRWCLATNHLNLMYMLSAGLILSPRSFGKKYYADSLKTFPGWIPLFADMIPKQAMDLSLSEADHLKPCVATLDLSSLRGELMVILRDGEIRKVAFPDELDGNEAVLLIPAPLPTAWIEVISFRSKEDKQSCDREAQEYANVPLNDFQRSLNPRLLAGHMNNKWPLTDFALPDRDSSPDLALAAGGMMAMLFQFANMGDSAVMACRLAFDGAESVAATIRDPLIRAFYDWLKTGIVPPTGDLLPELFWGAVNAVAGLRSSVDGLNPLDAVLSFLDAARAGMDEKHHKALTKLSNELRSISGFADSTITEIFERHSRQFPRAMAMFFLRQRSSDLLEFRHPLLNENDYLAAALLFAARDSWLGLPADVRNQPGMNAAVSQRMAAMAHRLSGAGMDLGAPPPRCVPLREMFAPGAKGWSAKQKEAALHLAHVNQWNCIHTKVSLGKGEYRLLIDGSGTHILMTGEVKAVNTEVDITKFFQRLAETRLSGKVDKKIRDLLPKQGHLS